MWRVARRPKWIAALVLALVVAGVFAFLGQWHGECFASLNHNGPKACHGFVIEFGLHVSTC